MSQNLFTVESQTELNSLIHRPNDNCDGSCESCSKFHKAVKTLSAITPVTTLTINEETIVPNGYFQVWCEECSDGENNTFWGCCDWAERHAKRRHGAHN